MSAFGERFRKLRMKEGKTLEEMKLILHTTKATLSHYENDHRSPKISFAEKAAKYFGVSVDYMMGNSTQDIVLKRMDELKVTPEQASKATGVSLQFILTLNDHIPEPEDYEKLNTLSKYLDTHPYYVLKAYSKQEPPVYAGPTTTAEEDFKDPEDTIKIELYDHAIESGLSQEDIKEALEFAAKMKKKSKGV